MINVTQKSEREFIIEWDENDPEESIFNEFTEKDFIEVLTYYAERQLEVIKYSSKLKKKSRETNYYNSESEGKEYKEENINATYEDYKASPFYAPEEHGTWDCYHKDNTDAP